MFFSCCVLSKANDHHGEVFVGWDDVQSLAQKPVLGSLQMPNLACHAETSDVETGIDGIAQLTGCVKL